MRRLLVTGASGFLGWNICRILRSTWDVYGVVFSHALQIPGVRVLQVDVTDFFQVKQLFRQVQPDAVVHAAALSQPNVCQVNPIASRRINVEASIHIAGLCADDRIPCVFTSSDLVFNGLNPPYREEMPTCPVSTYGEHKVLAEEGMLQRYPNATICRLPLMFGEAGPVAVSFIQPWIQTMRRGGELKLFVDEYRTPISARTAVAGLMLALETVRGIIHLGGVERISRYDFGLKLKDALGIQRAKITPCYLRDVPMPAPRPPDVSLDSSKAYALGFKPRPIVDELTSVVNDLGF